MLPLSEIARLKATVSGDRRSPIADAAAAAWGYPPGSARFWRSSATHVFVLRGADGAGHEAFLRFVPASAVRRADVEAIAVLMARLAGRGLDTVPVLRSSKGKLIETIRAGNGRVHAMVVAAAPGNQVDAGDLTPELARAWGAALARLHRDGDVAATGLRLRDGRERIHRAFARLRHDRSIAEPLAALRSWLHHRQRDPACYGLVHGDFELDNLAWAADRPIAYDLDEAERSWFAADVAYAVRDLVPDPRALVDQPIPLLAAFLSGYRQARPSAAIGRQQLAAFTAVNALRSLARLAPVLAEDPSAGSELLTNLRGQPRPLRTVLESYADRQRQIAADLTPLLI